jgi:ER membrane protein complex subunit 7
MRLSALGPLLAAIDFTTAATLRVQIPPSNLLPNPNTLPASTHATLTSGTSPQLDAPLRRGSVLEFNNLTTPGSYLLDIFARDFTFAPYRVDITTPEDGTAIIEGVWETYRGTRWDDKGPLLGGSSADPTNAPPLQPQIITVSAKVLTKKNFYEDRPGFNPMSLLKNPMILLAIVALGITFGMPKLMENMDPEMKAEYEEMQKKSPVSGLTRAMQGQGPASNAAGGFDLASWMASAQQQQGNTKTSGAEAKDAGSIRERKR